MVCSVYASWEGAQQHSFYAAPSSEVNIGTDCGSLLWPRLWSSYGWQWWLWLLIVSRRKLLVSCCCPFLPMVGSSNQKDPSFYQIWHAGTQSGSRVGVLWSGTHSTITVPGSWCTDALAAALVQCLKCGSVQISHGTRVWVSRSCCSVSGRKEKCSSSSRLIMTRHNTVLGSGSRV